MSELESLTAAVETALDREKIKLWKDVIQIGIPSFVTVVGMFVSFQQFKKSQKKDIKIQNLMLKHDREKQIEVRKEMLLEKIIFENEQAYNLFLEWQSKVGARLSMLKVKEKIPEDLERAIESLFGDASAVVKNKTSRRSTDIQDRHSMKTLSAGFY